MNFDDELAAARGRRRELDTVVAQRDSAERMRELSDVQFLRLFVPTARKIGFVLGQRGEKPEVAVHTSTQRAAGWRRDAKTSLNPRPHFEGWVVSYVDHGGVGTQLTTTTTGVLICYRPVKFPCPDDTVKRGGSMPAGVADLGTGPNALNLVQFVDPNYPPQDIFRDFFMTHDPENKVLMERLADLALEYGLDSSSLA